MKRHSNAKDDSVFFFLLLYALHHKLTSVVSNLTKTLGPNVNVFPPATPPSFPSSQACDVQMLGKIESLNGERRGLGGTGFTQVARKQPFHLVHSGAASGQRIKRPSAATAPAANLWAKSERGDAARQIINAPSSVRFWKCRWIS